MKKIISLSAFVALSTASHAQCAMCKATLENNISNGNIGIAAGINFGILYMFVAPYLAVATLAYFWYRTSKRNEKFSKGSMAR
jgi:hypothetical protein